MGMRLMSSLDDHVLWDIYLEKGDRKKPTTAATMVLMGNITTNPKWVWARAADQLLDRNIISRISNA